MPQPLGWHEPGHYAAIAVTAHAGSLLSHLADQRRPITAACAKPELLRA